MFGKIKLVPFEEMIIKDRMPQSVASAWAAIKNSDLVGVDYTPLLYCAEQDVKGVNHWFICGQTLITHPPTRRLVKLAVNEFDGKFEVVKESIEDIFG